MPRASTSTMPLSSRAKRRAADVPKTPTARLRAAKSKRLSKPDKATRGLARRIVELNTGRDPQRLQMKYDAMRASPFAFLRGTARLFYEDLPSSRLLER